MPYSKPAVVPEWIKVAEAAARLNCHPKTVLNRIRAGTIPARTVRIGRLVRINRQDFEAYLESLATPPTDQP